MPELRVVAVSNDGTRLVLKAADATEYTLPIDERLRALHRRARSGQAFHGRRKHPAFRERPRPRPRGAAA